MVLGSFSASEEIAALGLMNALGLFAAGLLGLGGTIMLLRMTVRVTFAEVRRSASAPTSTAPMPKTSTTLGDRPLAA